MVESSCAYRRYVSLHFDDFLYEEDSINTYYDRIYSVRSNMSHVFYAHIDNVLAGKCAPDDGIIYRSLCHMPSSRTSEQLAHLLDRLKHNQTLTEPLKLKIIRLLIAWQSQFSDVRVLDSIVDFGRRELDMRANVANFKHGDVNTLALSIRSNCVSVVRRLVEELDACDGLNEQNLLCILRISIRLNCAWSVFEYLIHKFYPLKFPASLINEFEFVSSASVNTTKILFILLGKYTDIDPKQATVVFNYLGSLREKINNDEFVHILFDKFGLDLTRRFFGNRTSAFTMCFEFLNARFARTIIDRLVRQTPHSHGLMITETLLKNLEPTAFGKSLGSIEPLLNSIDDKTDLYARILTHQRGSILKPSEDQLKTTCLPNGNLYFYKIKLLVKYDVIPACERMEYLRAFVELWCERCAGRTSSYVSAVTTDRYLSQLELAELIYDYVRYLFRNSLVERSILVDGLRTVQCVFDANRVKMDAKQYVRDCFNNEPLRLTLIARNRVRSLLVSLSDSNIGTLRLPANLVAILRPV